MFTKQNEKDNFNSKNILNNKSGSNFYPRSKNKNNEIILNSTKNNPNSNITNNQNINNNFSSTMQRRNSNSKLFSAGKNQTKISNEICNVEMPVSQRAEKPGNFLYNIINNSVKPYEAEFKILSARLSRKGAISGTGMGGLRDSNFKSIENFAGAKNSLKEKISNLNSNNTTNKQSLNCKTALNSNLNLQNSNSNTNLVFNNSSNASIKFNLSHKNKSSGSKSNFITVSASKIVNKNLKSNVKNKNYDNNANADINNHIDNDKQINLENNNNQINKNLADNGNTAFNSKIKGIQIKNFNQVLQNNFVAGAKTCYSNSDRNDISKKKV